MIGFESFSNPNGRDTRQVRAVTYITGTRLQLGGGQELIRNE